MNTALSNVPVQSLDPWQTWPVTIQTVRHECPNVFTIGLAFKNDEIGQKYRFAPGQFNMLYVPGVGEAAISVAGQTDRKLLQHTIRSVGSVTNALVSASVGDSIGLRGPFGVGWPLSLDTNSPESGRKASDLIIVAGGVGLAPLRSLVHHVSKHRRSYANVSLLIGARSPEDMLYEDEQSDWRTMNIDVKCTVDRAPSNWKGRIGVVTSLLDGLSIRNPESTIVMTCGPEVMMRYVAKAATGRGIPEQNIWVTLERNMNCAIGLCGHCQLGPKVLCRDGPVFRYDSVKPWLRVQEL